MSTSSDQTAWKSATLENSITSLDMDVDLDSMSPTTKLLSDSNSSKKSVTLRSSSAAASSSASNTTIISGLSNYSNSTNGYVGNGNNGGYYNNLNNNNLMTRCCYHLLNSVQRNIRRCVTALVCISLISIIFFTQYMDSQTIVK